MKTERMVLMIGTAEKAEITSRAKALGLTASEFVRRAAAAYEPAQEALLEELAVLGGELDRSADRLKAKLAEAERAAALTREHEEDREALRDEVRKELAQADWDWDSLASLFAGAGEPRYVSAFEAYGENALEPEQVYGARAALREQIRGFSGGAADDDYRVWRRRQVERLDRDFEAYKRTRGDG